MFRNPTPAEKATQAMAKAAEVSGIILAGAIQDAADLREKITRAADKARAVLASMPQDVGLSPTDGDALFSALEDLIGACSSAVSGSTEDEGETVRLLQKMALKEIA